MTLQACKYCNTKRNKDDMIKHNRQYFCNDTCLLAYKKQVADRKDLMGYLTELYGKFPVKVVKQIEDFKKQGMTYKGQELSLRYWYDTLEKEFNEEMGMGIIPYIYEDAKQFFMDKQRIAKCANNIQEDKIVHSGKSKNVALEKYKLRRNNDL